MAYREIYNEYVSLIDEKAKVMIALDGTKHGYISVKKISGREYAYLQYRVGGKPVSRYIKKGHLDGVRAELHKRAKLQERLAQIEAQRSKLESAAAILDGGLYRSLVNYRRCALMDAMPLEERQKSLAFGNAMAALEGIPAGEQAERNLSSWLSGRRSFRESYLDALQAHHLAEVER